MYIHSLKFSCSKSYEDFPCSHRQWRHEGHCRFVHGYSRSFTFWFTAKKLDLNGFVVDFSSLKPLEKKAFQNIYFIMMFIPRIKDYYSFRKLIINIIIKYLICIYQILISSEIFNQLMELLEI